MKISHAGICGSDMTIYHGKHPRAKAPLTFGHEFSGTLVGNDGPYPEGKLVTAYPYLSCGHCEPCRKGQSNCCTTLRLIGIDVDGGMADYVAVPNDSIVEVPEGISAKMAAFIEPVGINVHTMIHGGYTPGDRVVIFGAGPIGLSLAITLQHFGAETLLLYETDPTRLQLARSLDIRTFSPGPDVLAQTLELTGGNGPDCVFDCAGHQSVASLLPDMTRIGGTMVIVAGYHEPPVLNFQQCMMKEQHIQFVRNCGRREFDIAATLVAKEKRYERLVSHVLPAEEAVRGFELMDGRGEAVKVMFRFDG